MTTQTLTSKATLSSTQTLTPRQTLSETLLSNKQLVVVITLGVFLWFVFALIVRFTSGTGILGGVSGVVTFVLSIPLAWLVVEWIRRLAGLAPSQIVSGLSLSTGAAALCDGVSMTWTSLYGSDPSWSFLGAAYILWGVGVILTVAYLMAAAAHGKMAESN